MRGNYSEEALAAYAELVAASAALNFAEGDTYDFTRCIKPDGTTFGTPGNCTPPNRPAGPSKEEKEADSLMSGGRRHSRAMQRVASKLREKAAAANYSEDNTYDFTRCVRPYGSAYGTRGRCNKGTESAKEAAKPAATRSGSRGPTDHAGRVAKHEGEYNKHAAAHKAAKEELKGHRGRDLAARVKRQQLAHAAQVLEDKRDVAHDKLMKAKRGLFAADEKAKRKP